MPKIVSDIAARENALLDRMAHEIHATTCVIHKGLRVFLQMREQPGDFEAFRSVLVQVVSDLDTR